MEFVKPSSENLQGMPVMTILPFCELHEIRKERISGAKIQRIVDMPVNFTNFASQMEKALKRQPRCNLPF